jgi:hypothetical protein
VYYSIKESSGSNEINYLDPNHTHFILVDSDEPNRGEETVYVEKETKRT